MAPTQHRVGAVQVAPYSEYQRGAAGFVVEQLSYTSYHNDPPCWVIPAWEERGYGDLGDVFPTREAAERAIREAF